MVNLNAGTTGQQITISGTYNYEFMAGPNLVMDVKPRNVIDASAEDREKARLISILLE